MTKLELEFLTFDDLPEEAKAQVINWGNIICDIDYKNYQFLMDGKQFCAFDMEEITISNLINCILKGQRSWI